jgi:hypothetical protein
MLNLKEKKKKKKNLSLLVIYSVSQFTFFIKPFKINLGIRNKATYGGHNNCPKRMDLHTTNHAFSRDNTIWNAKKKAVSSIIHYLKPKTDIMFSD